MSVKFPYKASFVKTELDEGQPIYSNEPVYSYGEREKDIPSDMVFSPSELNLSPITTKKAVDISGAETLIFGKNADLTLDLRGLDKDYISSYLGATDEGMLNHSIKNVIFYGDAPSQIASGCVDLDTVDIYGDILGEAVDVIYSDDYTEQLNHGMAFGYTSPSEINIHNAESIVSESLSFLMNSDTVINAPNVKEVILSTVGTDYDYGETKLMDMSDFFASRTKKVFIDSETMYATGDGFIYLKENEDDHSKKKLLAFTAPAYLTTADTYRGERIYVEADELLPNSMYVDSMRISGKVDLNVKKICAGAIDADEVHILNDDCEIEEGGIGYWADVYVPYSSYERYVDMIGYGNIDCYPGECLDSQVYMIFPPQGCDNKVTAMVYGDFVPVNRDGSSLQQAIDDGLLQESIYLDGVVDFDIPQNMTSEPIERTVQGKFHTADIELNFTQYPWTDYKVYTSGSLISLLDFDYSYSIDQNESSADTSQMDYAIYSGGQGGMIVEFEGLKKFTVFYRTRNYGYFGVLKPTEAETADKYFDGGAFMIMAQIGDPNIDMINVEYTEEEGMAGFSKLEYDVDPTKRYKMGFYIDGSSMSFGFKGEKE